jgi:hypothetical protein
MMRKALIALASIAVLSIPTAGSAAFHGGMGGRSFHGGMGGGFGARQSAMVGTRAAFVPSGFHHGHKIGFRGRHVPPGWSHGLKVGWHHASMPPGLHR